MNNFQTRKMQTLQGLVASLSVGVKMRAGFRSCLPVCSFWGERVNRTTHHNCVYNCSDEN